MRSLMASTTTKSMRINYTVTGHGRPLLLVHGLGSSWHTWKTVMPALAQHRTVVAIDLPGSGGSPALEGETTVAALTDAISAFLHDHDLLGSDAAGASLGARLVLELARRGDCVGTVVSLNPMGFFAGWDRHFFAPPLWFCARVAQALQQQMPMLAQHGWTRSLLMRRFVSRPRDLGPELVVRALASFVVSPGFNMLLRDLTCGPSPAGHQAGRRSRPIVIAWGRDDCICRPHQAALAQQLYPHATLHWFERCGHFPHWDAPDEAARLILETTST